MKKSSWGIDDLKSWLVDNENYFNFSLNETICEKWNKWQKNKSIHIYPCVCQFRDDACVFIETYHKIDKVCKLHAKEEYFGRLGELHKQAGDDKEKTLEWLLKCKQVFDDLEFSPTVEIVTNLMPYKTIKFQLNETDFQSIIGFQKTYLNELSIRKL